MLAWQTERLLELEVARDAWTVYVRPELMAEVAFSDIQASRRYPGGFALRFARVKRYRPDKNCPTPVATVRALFEHQQMITGPPHHRSVHAFRIAMTSSMTFCASSSSFGHK